MELNGIVGGFYKLTVWITNFAAANLLWLFFNLPIIFLIFQLVFVENINQLIVGITVLTILTPFFFFPATTALFAVVRQWVLGRDVSTIALFWKYYRENYKKSMQGGFVLAVFWFILALDYYYSFIVGFEGLLTYFFLVLTLGLVVFTLHYFSIIVHLDTKLAVALKNAMMLTFGKPLTTLKIGFMSFMIIYTSTQVLTFLIPFFIGSLTAYVSFASFYKVVVKIRPETV